MRICGGTGGGNGEMVLLRARGGVWQESGRGGMRQRIDVLRQRQRRRGAVRRNGSEKCGSEEARRNRVSAACAECNPRVMRVFMRQAVGGAQANGANDTRTRRRQRKNSNCCKQTVKARQRYGGENQCSARGRPMRQAERSRKKQECKRCGGDDSAGMHRSAADKEARNEAKEWQWQNSTSAVAQQAAAAGEKKRQRASVRA